MYHKGISEATVIEAIFILILGLSFMYVFRGLLRKSLIKWWPNYEQEYQLYQMEVNTCQH